MDLLSALRHIPIERFLYFYRNIVSDGRAFRFYRNMFSMGGISDAALVFLLEYFGMMALINWEQPRGG